MPKPAEMTTAEREALIEAAWLPQKRAAPTPDAASLLVEGGVVERVAAFLLLRDETLGPGEATDAERAESARCILESLTPIPMVLHCPRCGLQHIDKPEPEELAEEDRPIHWTNPPHRSHQCQGCMLIWRPADVPTTGVAAITTKGKADNYVAPPDQGGQVAAGRPHAFYDDEREAMDALAARPPATAGEKG